MNLAEYIRQIGDAEAARLFGVKTRTTMSWRLGDRVPRGPKAAEIVRLTSGAVSFEGIYGLERRAS